MNQEDVEAIAVATEEESEVSIDKQPEVSDLKELEPLEESSKITKFEKITMSLLVVSIVLSGVLLILYYPFSNKISGSWVTNPEATLVMKSKGREFTISQTHHREQGMTYEYHGKWYPIGINKYQGREMTIDIKINKEAYDDKQLAELRGEKDVFTVTSEDKQFINLTYTQKSLDSMFKGKPLENFFVMTLLHPKGVGGPEQLEWNSAYFSEELIYLDRK